MKNPPPKATVREASPWSNLAPLDNADRQKLMRLIGNARGISVPATTRVRKGGK